MRLFTALRSATGTGPRFVLLMALVTVSSIPLFDGLFGVVAATDNPRRGLDGAVGCLYAAGYDPSTTDLNNLLATLRRPEALVKCLGEQPESYRGTLATLALLAVAGLVYWWLPKVRDRRRTMLPVEEVDADGTLGAELAALREHTGVRSDLRFRVDPRRLTSGASVYGRTGDYTVCLHAGLVARRGTDPEGFRAVVLHELAHVHHRDVDYAYASTALWRVFVLLALLPEFALVGWIVALALSGTDSPWWPGALPEMLSTLFACLLLAGLVHLARADLLRRREFHADLQAVAWGAHPATWDRSEPPGVVAPLLRRLTALLRTHPDWAERRRVLADSRRLLRVSPLEMFLTGASASLLYGSLATLPLLSGGRPNALWPTLALVAPVLCCALGLPVVRAVRTDRRTDSGASAGLWFGCGLLVGEFVASGRYRLDWLPQQPQLLLVFLFIGAVPVVWWTQSLRLVLGLSKRRVRWAAAGLCALVTTTLLWAELLWWRWGGERIALGAGDAGGALAKQYREMVPGRWQDYGFDLSTLSVGMSLLTPLYGDALVAAAALLLWLVPLVLLLLQRAGPGLRVRRTLGAGLAGGLLSWAGMAAAQVALYVQRPATPKARTGPFLIVHAWWMIVGLMAACLLTAALVAAFSRRHWLLRALIAAQVVQLMSYGGVFLLYSADGCLGPLNTVFDRCQWHAHNGLVVDRGVTLLTLPNAVIGAGCAALVGAGVAWSVRRLRGRPRPDVPVLPASTGPVRRRLRFLKTATVLALGVPALLLTVVLHTQPSSSPVAGRLPQDTDAAAPHHTQGPAGPDKKKPRPTPPARKSKLSTWQVWSWLNNGGSRHAQQIAAASLALNSQVLKAAAQPRNKNGKVSVDEKPFHRLCGALGARVEAAQNYLPVPDQGLQDAWSDALARVRSGARGCQAAMIPPKGAPHRTEAERAQLFTTSLNGIVGGVRGLTSTVKDITKAATWAAK
ncbi:M48 family metalloprotease [Streptomyces lydicus]|uniref:M48 family metalloprotease n=1 Tax=Streptomyces lydicus TaxID=47763 RepID=UPI0037CD6076